MWHWYAIIQEPGKSCRYGMSSRSAVRVLARSGIDQILVAINGGVPVSASYGIPRPDVARIHPEVADAGQSGYRYFWDTAGRPEGPCDVRVTAVARNGDKQELICRVCIDRTASPGYDMWIARNEPTLEALRRMRLETGELAQQPRISVVVPVYKTPAALLTSCMASVMAQTYLNWELCLADDGSADPGVNALLQKAARSDSRIRVLALPENRGISAATNAALRVATGDFVAFLDHDDELAPFALSELVRSINAHADTDIFYSDEDKIDERGHRYDAFFKPGWSPELFLSCNYICHFLAIRRTVLEQIGALDENYRGAQDYELLLRASEQTQRIKRIPKVLYHWRAIQGSTAKAAAEKPEASADGKERLHRTCNVARREQQSKR